MKTAIITYNDVANYGALLQAYALQDYVEKLGNECKHIAYRPFKTDKIIEFSSIGSIVRGCYSILHLPAIKKRAKLFVDFKDRYLNMTGECFTGEQQRMLNNDFDCFITGSDQVFNCQRGINKPFYLDFAEEDKIIASYAASFGTDSIPEKYGEEVAELLNRFDFISVREESGSDIINKLIGKEPEVVLDPVFLRTKEEWSKVAGERIEKEKYIFVYPTQKNAKLDALVKRLHKETGLKVITTRPSLKYKHVIKMGPAEFVNYIKNAEYVVTASFHATAFSVIFEKPLFVVSHSERGTRTTSLLKKAGLEKCIIKDVAGECKFSADYKEVWKNMDKYVAESKEFLKTIFEKREIGK